MISPTVTPTLRNTLFTTIPSAGGIPYTDFGRVLDYSTQVGPFTIVDKSGEGNTATLYSGRGLTMDAVGDNVTYATGYSSAERTATLLGRFNVVSPVVLGGQSGFFTFYPTATGVWEELTATATVSGDLDWELGSDFDIGDLRVGTEHWTHNDWSDPTADGLNGKTIVDSGPNGYHGTCTGCSGFTGEGIDPEVAGIVGYDDAQWFNGTDSYVDCGANLITAYPFEITGTVITTQESGVLSAITTGSSTSSAKYGIEVINSLPVLRCQSSSAGGQQVSGSTSVADGLPHIIRAVFTSSTSRELFVDGASVGTDVTAIPFEGSDKVNIGRQYDVSPSNYYEGTVIDVNIDNVAAYTGLGATPWTDTIGSNDGTPSGTFVTVGQKRASIPQTADKNWNKYQWFNGTDTKVDSSSHVSTVASKTKGRITGTILASGLPANGQVFGVSDKTDGTSDVSVRVSDTDKLQFVVRENAVTAIRWDSDLSVRDGEQHDFDVAMSASGLVVTIDGVVATGTFSTGNPTTVTWFADVNDLDFMGLGYNIDSGGDQFFFEGAITNLTVYDEDGTTPLINYTGLGNDPWADTIGSNDGTESGTFTSELVSASDANDQIDALGTAILEPRRNTQQLNLFGDGEHSSTPDSDSLDLTTEATWEIWGNFYGVPSVGEFLFSKYKPTNNKRSWVIQKNASQQEDEIGFSVSNDGNFSTLAAIAGAQDKVQCLSVTLSGGVYVAYLDAQVVTLTGAIDTTVFTSDEPVMIGAQGDFSKFATRKIGSAKIYNRALTADEVLTNYDTQKSLYNL